MLREGVGPGPPKRPREPLGAHGPLRRELEPREQALELERDARRLVVAVDARVVGPPVHRLPEPPRHEQRLQEGVQVARRTLDWTFGQYDDR